MWFYGLTIDAQSEFYRIYALCLDGQIHETLFSVRSAEHHKILQTQVAHRFCGENDQLAERAIDRSTAIFLRKMRQHQGSTIDLEPWLKFWAFDTNAAIEFGRCLGFQEAEDDIQDIIRGVDAGFRLGVLVGQVPWINGWLIENHYFMSALRTLTGIPDPPKDLTRVSLRSDAYITIVVD